MVLENGSINIIADMEGTTGVKLHNKRQKLRSRFDIIKKLGQGTYGKVQLAINKDTGEEVAIKTIKKSKIETEQDLVRIQREIQIMSSVQHPHIIHIYEVFENREKIVLVMEYASGGELYDYISFKKVLEEAEARRVFRQVAAAVFYCHKNMICHRDLKLENILLDERGCAKIADFGLSNVFDERNFLSTFCGSPLYASPEIVRGTPYYGPEVDCWSLGVLLYTLVYGAMPFDGSNFKKLVRQISEGDYYEPRVPSEASHLIRRMLTVDPAKRANIGDICCDVWVDMGEDTPLLDVAEEMCKLMPVRLDYLLAATATQPAPSAVSSPSQPPPPPPPLPSENSVDQTIQDTALRVVTAAAAADGSEIDRLQDEAISQKKAKLATSSSTLANGIGLRASDIENVDGATGNALEATDGDVDMDVDMVESAEINAMEKREAVNAANVEGQQTDAATEQPENNAADEIMANVEITGATAEVAVEPVETECSSTPTKKRVSLVKRSSFTSASASSSRLNKSSSAVASSQSGSSKAVKTSTVAVDGGSGSGPSSPVTKMPNLRKSSTGVVGSKNGSESNEGETERRKSSLTSSKTIEAHRKLSIGSKVSSVRRAFESPPSSPSVAAAAKVTKAPVLPRKNSEPSENVCGDSSTTDSKKPILVRQGSRKFGVPRSSVSPVKTARVQQNHHSCVPNESKVAVAEEAKKSTSPPPKPIVRRPTPPAPVAAAPAEPQARKFGLAKVPSFTKVIPAARRASAPCRPSTVRPKSPVKSVKAAPTNVEKLKANEEIVEACVQSMDDQKDVLEQQMSPPPPLVGKRGSIEIAPLPLVSREDKTEEDVPLIRFVPRDQGQFTLLGVKSEVVFDVDAGNDDVCATSSVDDGANADVNGDAEVEQRAAAREVSQEAADNSKVIRYVATVRRHGSEDAADAGPERVTLLNIRRSATGLSEAESETGSTETEQMTNSSLKKTNEDSRVTSEFGVKDRFERMSSRTSDDVVEERKTEQSTTERRGYSVYRSKYRSVQKYRSVVERRDSERSTDEGSGRNAEADEVDEIDDLPAGDLVRSRVNVERSESFSSAGSTDELEDVFESLTSESLFTSLLNRTRNLIERITDGDNRASRFFEANLFCGGGSGRVTLGAERGNPTSAMSLLISPPSLSFRRSPISTANFERSGYDSKSSRDYNRSPTSDGRRWRPSRSSTRGADDHEHLTFTDTGSNIRLRATASFNSSDYSSSAVVGRSYGGDSTGRRHQSRYESFRGQDDSMSSPLADSANRRREEARSDIISALLRHRNRSLDGRRPRSLYDDRDDYASSSSSSATTTTTNRGGSGGYQSGREQYSEEDWRDSNAKADAKSSLYGTIRRPSSRYPRYTKSMSKEMEADDYDSNRNLRRPRSIHEILSNNLGNVNGGGVGAGNDDVINDDDDDDGTISRDYSKSGSKSVKRIGSTERAEEEEYEREHRVTQNAAGRSVTTTHKQVSRSVSQTEDEDKSRSSSSSSATVHVHTSTSRSSNRKIGDDGISRQDSGVGSLCDSGGPMPPSSSSSPSTSTAAGFRRGRVMKYDRRSVSNDLESLEEEMTRFGLRGDNDDDDNNRHEQWTEHFSSVSGSEHCSGDQHQQEMEAAAAAAAKTDGAASDSADTGSVCSDASGAATETSSSTVKASEEESVGERIRRKSFFARFNDTTTTRVPRKSRMSEPSSPSSSAATAASTTSAAHFLRSDLSRSSSLRQRIFDEEPFTMRSYYDGASSDLYGMSYRYVPQRWSSHFGSGNDPDFQANYDTGMPPRRRSFNDPSSPANQYHNHHRHQVGGRPSSRTWADDGSTGVRPTSPMSRTRSLPEDGDSTSNDAERHGAYRQTSTTSSSRPNHLNLHTNYSSEEADEWLSPSGSPSRFNWRPSTTASSRRSSRLSPSSQPTASPSSSVSSSRGYGGGNESIDDLRRRPPTASGLVSSLMDTIDSPSEVLQKAMDLCDSLRYNT